MIHYLLGELSEQERNSLEERYFSDVQVFNELSRVENELIDDYVRGRLSAVQRRRFEQVYLGNSVRRQRVKFAEALLTKADQASKNSVESPNGVIWWQNLFTPLTTNRLTAGFAVAALSLLVICCIWLFSEYRRLRQELVQTKAAQSALEKSEQELKQQIAQEQEKSSRLANELSQSQNTGSNQNNPTPSSTRSFVSLIIGLSGTRNTNLGGPSNLVIPTATNEVRMQIQLNDNSYQRYVVRIQTAAGKEVFSQRDLRTRQAKGGANLNLTVPATTLESGDYLVIVQGKNQHGDIDDVSKSLVHVTKH